MCKHEMCDARRWNARVCHLTSSSGDCTSQPTNTKHLKEWWCQLKKESKKRKSLCLNQTSFSPFRRLWCGPAWMRSRSDASSGVLFNMWLDLLEFSKPNTQSLSSIPTHLEVWFRKSDFFCRTHSMQQLIWFWKRPETFLCGSTLRCRSGSRSWKRRRRRK